MTMADYLLDTNHLSTMVTEKHLVRLRIQMQLRFGDTFAIATPTLTEMLYGIQMLPRSRRNLADWQKLSVMFTTTPLSAAMPNKQQPCK